MTLDRITTEMWRKALRDSEDACDLLHLIEVANEGGLVPLTHVDSGNGPIAISSMTLEQCTHAVCALCPSEAFDS